jgi:hypothetical protein
MENPSTQSISFYKVFSFNCTGLSINEGFIVQEDLSGSFDEETLSTYMHSELKMFAIDFTEIPLTVK